MNFLKITGLLLLSLFAVSHIAVKAGANEDKLKSKLSQPFTSKGNWISDFDEARKIAKKKNKPIFVYFTRSYSP